MSIKSQRRQVEVVSTESSHFFGNNENVRQKLHLRREGANDAHDTVRIDAIIKLNRAMVINLIARYEIEVYNWRISPIFVLCYRGVCEGRYQFGKDRCRCFNTVKKFDVERRDNTYVRGAY